MRHSHVGMTHPFLRRDRVDWIPSIPILVSVLFPSLHLKYFRIKFLVCVIVYKPFHNCFFLIYKIYPVTVYSVCVYVCTTVYVYMCMCVCVCELCVSVCVCVQPTVDHLLPQCFPAIGTPLLHTPHCHLVVLQNRIS